MRATWLSLLFLTASTACSDLPETEPPIALTQPIAASLVWPEQQLLPSFPAPAAVQDLITLRGRNARWQAESTIIGHKTGRLETDGWLCQVGIDKANEHMVYGPYDKTLPAGGNTAEFRLMTDNNTVNDDALVTLEAYDTTAGQLLASKVVTRKQFSADGEYVTISLPFSLAADEHALELRVFWTGAGYTKVDWVGVTRSQADDELVLFSSLKGIVNAKQPRIFSYEGDAFAEGPHAWLESLELPYAEVADPWTLIDKYRSELSGLVVYDNSQPDTINLATTLAGSKGALVVAPSLAARLVAAPYNLPILLDFRGKFTSKLDVYQTLYDQYWPTLTHRLAFGLSPTGVRASVREYATALGAATLWLDPEKPDEAPLLKKFLASMGAGSTWMGWWPNEGPGVAAGSDYGVATVASDFASNLTLHSGMPRTIRVKPMPAKPALQNKLYVAFILSDGDNLQYVEHLMRKLWANPDRGKVPIGWTLSPAMVDAMPGALAYYWKTATENDALISGPSGYGYTYPNQWKNPDQLAQFVKKTEEYNQRAGFRVVTVWNTITGGIDKNVGESFADHAPTLLGLTAQNTGGGLTIYKNSLPGMALSCNYCTGEQAMKDFIASSSQGWNKNEPRFLIIQAQPWQDVRPTSFMNVANSLGGDYVVVRPDIIFQLLREAKGLPVNPVSSYSISASAGPNGQISPNGTLTLEQNHDQTFTMTPNPGFAVSSISVDGASLPVASSYSFVNVTANHTIAVTFADPTTLPMDAGTTDAGVTDAGGIDASAPDAGKPDAGSSAPPSDDGARCGCRMPGAGTASSSLWSLVGLGLLVGLARRRTSRAR